ncbi:MAG TPA: hypothetical protein VKU19_14930 [Bryobacteraceae bacterium]|nr:hypothetical protein [Bryobacteraceae bacterium]
MRAHEVYKLVCHLCGREVELPAGPADRIETLACPLCGTELAVEWRPGEVVVEDRCVMGGEGIDAR